MLGVSRRSDASLRPVTRRKKNMNEHRLGLLATALTLSLPAVAQTGTGSRFDDFVPVTDAMLQNPAPADWLMWRRTLDSWGYSPLTEIDKRNVGELELAWSHDIGTGNQEATPLVYRGVMYVPNRGDYIQAF